MKSNIRLNLLFFGLFSFIIGTESFGQISISNMSNVSENFDGIGTSATATLPTNWKMTAAGTASPTWSSASNVTATQQQASSGTPTTGARYNWGDGVTTSNRSIGFMTSGGYASPNSIMAFYQNNTGAIINDLAFAFDYRRFRINTAAAALTFFTSTDGSTWTARTAGDESGITFTGSSAYNFNPSTVASKSFTLTGINIPSGGNFYLRWNFNTTGSSSQGLALDNVVIRATATSSSSVVPTKLVVTDVNSSATVYRNTSFNVTVQAQDGSGVPGNVTSNTLVTLAVGTGSGVVVGSGTILAGSSSVVISTTYSIAENNVVLVANRTSGDVLTSGNSTPFNVQYPILLSETFGTAAVSSSLCDAGGQANQGALPTGWTLSTGTPGLSPCGNWGVANGTAASSGYTGASGASNLLINNYTTNSTLAVISKSIDATGASGIGIQYGSRGTSTFSQGVSLYWSIDNGSTWNLLYTDYNSTGGWRLNQLLVLPAAANNASNLIFKWETVQNNTTSGNYRIDDVIVTQGNPFILPTQISITGINAQSGFVSPQSNYPFGVRFQLLDASGIIRAVTTSSNFTISKTGGSGSLTGTTTITLAPGAFQGDFTGLNYSAVESGVTFTITQTSGDIVPAGSKSGMSIIGLTQTIVPQNINSINELNGYFPTYLGLSGLSPNTTYNYYYTILNGITDVAAGYPGFSGSSYGGGNMIASNGSSFTRFTSISVASTTSATLTTDASGNYSGWFISESGTGSTRINPGQDVYFRLTLNNGPGSANTPANVFTTTQSARARTLTTSSNASSATEIYGNSLATAKNIVLVWDNVAGTGRPIAGTILEDGGITYSGTDAIYSTLVDGVDKAWSTLIPNDNANGVRRIAQYSLSSGALIYANTSTGTIWNSFETANPTGGTSTPIYLPVSVAPLTNASFLSYTGSLNQFAASPGSPSIAQTITVSGNLLTGSSTASVSSSNFELSTNGSTYGSNVTLSTLTPSFSQVLYVRFKPASGGSFSDVITLSSPGATNLTITVSGATTSTYTWIGTNGSSWATASNWSPTRTTPSTADILNFNGFSGSIIGVTTQTIEALNLVGSNVTLNASSSATITIGNTAGNDFNVDANSTLNLGGSSAITLQLATGNSGSVYGNLVASNATAHRFQAASAAAPLTFYAGATVTQAGSGALFGSVANSAVFQSGSSYYHTAGANPFTATLFANGSSIVYNTSSGFSTTGRTFPTLRILQNTNMSSSTAPASIDNLIVESGASVTFNGSPSTVINNASIVGTFVYSSSGTLSTTGVFHLNALANGNLVLASLYNTGTLNVFANTLSVTGTLTNNGTINIGDNGTLLQGSSSANAGTFNISRVANNSNDWSFYASPVNNGSVSNLGNSIYYYFDETAANSYTKGWTYASGTMTNGKGYIAFPGRLTFSGVANNGNVSIPVTYTSTGDLTADVTAAGWNLIGNPYPSAISKANFASSNGSNISGGAVYVWKTQSGTDNYSALVTNVPSGQAFFIQVPSGASSIVFNNGMRNTANSSTAFARTEAQDGPKVNLRLDNGRDWQELQVGLDASATDGYDAAYDANVLNGNPNISFYSGLGAKKLAIQQLALPISNSKEIPLYYNATKAGSYKISQIGIENPDPRIEVYLKDNQSGIETNLATTTVVTTSLTTGTDINRFNVVFRQAAVTSTQNQEDATNVWFASAQNDQLAISFKSTSSTWVGIQVADVMGRPYAILNQGDGNEIVTLSTSSYAKGVYLVKVAFANGKVETKKVVIE